MAVVNDILRGTRSRYDKNGLKQVTRIITVSELTGTSFITIESSAITAASLVIGNAHPDIDNMYLKDIRVELISTKEARIQATYFRGTLSTTNFEVVGSVTSRRIQKDKNGNLMELTTPSGVTDTVDSYVAETIKLMPQTVVKIMKTGIYSSASSAVSDSKQYTGYINSDSFLGGSSGNWLCTMFSISDSGPDNAWVQTSVCQYNPDGWDIELSYRMSDGRVSATQDSNSQKTFEIYGETSFSGLD